MSTELRTAPEVAQRERVARLLATCEHADRIAAAVNVFPERLQERVLYALLDILSPGDGELDPLPATS